jgi:hypothetical protein
MEAKVATHRFSVFGSLIAVDGEPGNWSAYVLGAEGKRRPASFIVPAFLGEEELCQYLADLFHESATPANGDVHRIE